MSACVPFAPFSARRRLVELAVIAGNAARLVTGARMADGQALASLAVEADASLRDAASRFGLPDHWAPGDRLPTVADVAVIEVRDGRELAAVLKLARSPAGDESLLRQQETLQRLAGDTTLDEWRRLLPGVLAHGVVGSRRYSIEKAVSGTVGTALPLASSTREASRSAVSAISELHRITGRAAGASLELVDRCLEPALSLVSDVPMLLGPTRRRVLVDRLREHMRSGMVGRSVWLSRTHGDYFPGNVFFGPTARVEAVIDWGQSREDDPALIDPMTFLLVGRAQADGKGLGSVVSDLCRGASLSEREVTLLEGHRSACPADPLGVDLMALLAWLRHVENNLLKSPRYRAHPAWVRSNLESVLEAVGGGRAR